MWEDTFTGMLKFRARWLVRKGDVPQDAISRLRSSAMSESANRNMHPSSEGVNKGDEEVFLTPKTDEIDARSIVRCIALSLSSSTPTDVVAGWKGRTGPRLTHAFDDSTGDFVPLGASDSIIKRARARRSEAIAIASRVDREKESAKSGKPICESNGWLTPIPSPSGQRRARGSSIGPAGVDDSDGTEVDDTTNPQDEEWEESEDDGGETTDSDVGAAKHPIRNALCDAETTPRKSARQRRSQVSPCHVSEVHATSQIPIPIAPSQTVTVALSQRRPRAPVHKRQGPFPPRPRRLVMPPMVKTVPAAAVDADKLRGESTPSSVAVAARPARTRTSTGINPRSSSTTPVGGVGREPTTQGKRKRGSALTVAHSLNQSDYPPRPTPVGEVHQAEIPLMLPEGKTTQAPANGARMVSQTLTPAVVA